MEAMQPRIVETDKTGFGIFPTQVGKGRYCRLLLLSTVIILIFATGGSHSVQHIFAQSFGSGGEETSGSGYAQFSFSENEASSSGGNEENSLSDGFAEETTDGFGDGSASVEESTQETSTVPSAGLTTSSTQKPNCDPSSPLLTRAKGSQGADVTNLQEILSYLGYEPGPVDGKYGPLTEGAVTRFQQTYSLQIDGDAGPETWGKLCEVLSSSDNGGLCSSTAQSCPIINVQYDVQLVPQETGYSCWAAGAAMLVGWRDLVSINPQEIANSIGYWKQYEEGLLPEDTTMFKFWGLVPEAPQSYTVDGFANLLQSYGPLWVASAEPGPHIRVVTGMLGDGTPDGTTLFINDPWQLGMVNFSMPNSGSTYTETYNEFVAKQEALAVEEQSIPDAIYVAHIP